jgi:hypothetical protein
LIPFEVGFVLEEDSDSRHVARAYGEMKRDVALEVSCQYVCGAVEEH